MDVKCRNHFNALDKWIGLYFTNAHAEFQQART